MSRQSVRAKRQARTDSAIEEFENKIARSFLHAKTNIDAEYKKLLAQQSLCKSNLGSDKINGIALPEATAIFRSCMQAAIDNYEISTAPFGAEHFHNMAELSSDLDNTLNHHLYSQEFEAYWRD